MGYKFELGFGTKPTLTYKRNFDLTLFDLTLFYKYKIYNVRLRINDKNK